jgi:hypothetical protein
LGWKSPATLLLLLLLLRPMCRLAVAQSRLRALEGTAWQAVLREGRGGGRQEQSRTVRLYNPMLEARIRALGQQLMSTAARIGLEEPGDPSAAAAAAAAEAHVQVCSGAEQVEGA